MNSKSLKYNDKNKAFNGIKIKKFYKIFNVVIHLFVFNIKKEIEHN